MRRRLGSRRWGNQKALRGALRRGRPIVDLVIPDVLEESCATRQALERLAAKWRVLVVYSLLDGPHRHADLRRRLPGITQKVLTETLRGMEADGLVERRGLRGAAPQPAEYETPHP